MNLYEKLADSDLLRRCWHLSRVDAKDSFLLDPYRYSDFAMRLDEQLSAISESLSSRAYSPHPLHLIDVPKSAYTARPGSSLEVQDRIVHFAIAYLIAPRVDKLLPPGVFSFRLDYDKKRHKLFKEGEVPPLPFLKRKTISARIEPFVPWYEAWPEFMRESLDAFERQGFRYMAVSDISSYFENIDIQLLRDLILKQLPNQDEIIDFLAQLLRHWSYSQNRSSAAPRGIPQGNSVSSFLGTFFLLPLDRAFTRFGNKKEIRYLRYVDDIMVLTKDFEVAREALFLMNSELRDLRLNVQGAKTDILEGEEIKRRIRDDRVEAVTKIIDGLSGKPSISAAARAGIRNQLRKYLDSIAGKRGIIKDRDLRLLRRLLTSYKQLNDPTLVHLTLRQLEKNPDARFLRSATTYLRSQTSRSSVIALGLDRLLARNNEFAPYHLAHYLMSVRYLREMPAFAWSRAIFTLTRRSLHWYPRQQAAGLLGVMSLDSRQMRSILIAYGREDNSEVKRTLLQPLSQLPISTLRPMIDSCTMSISHKMQRTGQFMMRLLADEKTGVDQVGSLFRDFNEEVFIDRIFEVELLSKSSSSRVQESLGLNLDDVRKRVVRQYVKGVTTFWHVDRTGFDPD